MTVTVKLFASLRIGRFREACRDYPAGTFVRQVVDELQIPDHHLGIIMLNGRHSTVDVELTEGDILWLMPVVAGG